VDAGELYLAPNPGEDPRPLARIASGGELSRVTLAIKTLVSTDTPGKTLIFDEVDSGIGGRVADVVGGHLRKLGERYQVLCITHLPQVATHGQTHFQITKHVKEGRTVTHVNRLAAEERVREVARLMAGIEVTPQVLAGAEEMLVARGESKTNTKGESESASPRQAVLRRDVRLSDELPRQRARRRPPRS
jgi:DNA repair protein RecN (Recombination protein N)